MEKQQWFVLFIIGLYLLFFNPPFSAFRNFLQPAYILLYISFFYIIGRTYFLKSHVFLFKKEFIITIILFIYAVVRCAFEGHFDYAYQHALGIVNVFILLPLLICFTKHKGFGDEEKIVKALLIVSAIAALISMYCIANPSFNQYLKESIFRISEDSYLYKNDWRGFGFSELLTSQYGYILGIIIAISCFYLKNNKWYLFFIPFVLLSIMVNARTGMLIVLFGILCNAFLAPQKSVFILLAVGFPIVYVGMGAIINTINVNTQTIEWMFAFQEEIEGTLANDVNAKTTVVDSLFGDALVWPSTTIEWIIGRGFMLFRNTYGVRSSDVGWINEINFGGLIYMAMLFYLLFIMFKRLLHHKGWAFTLFFFFSFVVINTKSTIYPKSNSLYLLMFIYYIVIYNSIMKKKKQIKIISK